MTSSLAMKVHNMHFVISLACFSFDTLFFLVCMPKGESWSQVFLTETMKTGDKNCGVMKAMYRKLEEMSSFSSTNS